MNNEREDLTNDLKNSIIKNENNFIQLILHRLGIVIHYHQIDGLHKTILNACHQFHCNAEDYLRMLADCPEDSPLLEYLIIGITVGETYFFRDAHQMQLLQETILPQLIKSKRAENNLSLRIWSAGCASGEEIYTISMMLFKLLPDIAAWRLQLLGTDLNTQSLQKAITGHYTEWSMRSISDHVKAQYFTREKNSYILSSQIRDLVTFSYLNLNDETYPSLFNGTNAQDLIICRNVLIYFDNNHINSVMTKLNDSLVPGGFLLLGASDPIVLTNTNLTFHHQLGTLFSRTAPGAMPIQPRTPPITKTRLEPIVPRNKPEISRPTTPVSPPKPLSTPHTPKTITQLSNEGQWQAVLTAINTYKLTNKKEESAILNAKALAYANLGRLEESWQASLDSLNLDATNKYTYFNLALTLTELNRLNEAEEALRKTLFLDRHFLVGHFQLGLLLLKKKQYELGMKSLTNALAIAEANLPTDPVPGYQGLNYGKLAEIFKHEVEMYAATGRVNHVG